MVTMAFTNGDGHRGLGSIIKCVLCELSRLDIADWPKTNIVINSYAYSNLYDNNIYNQFFISHTDILNINTDNNIIYCNQSHPCLPINDMWLPKRFEYNEILKYFFRPKDEIQKKINTMIQKIGKNPLVVHYRGNDKAKEVTLSSPEYFIDTCKKLIEISEFSSVFLATDSSDCLDLFLKNNFKIPLIYNDYPRIKSHNMGLHHCSNIDKQTLMENAIIDIFTLARGSIMISGISNFADIASILSPEMPWIYIR